MAKLNINSFQLAQDLGLPHDAILAKLKKYRNGADYKLELALFSATTNQFGKKENIYMLNRNQYDKCVKDEENKRKVNSAKQSEQGKVNILHAHAANAEKAKLKEDAAKTKKKK